MSALQTASRTNKAVVIHTITKKGKGYVPAESHPSKYHAVTSFSIDNGEPVNKDNGKSYTQAFSSSLIKLAKNNEKVVAVTAAMPYGTGLAAFKKYFPDRFFDVGIAEGHAVTFAAGMAAEGLRPVVAIYSTFLQRAYDQIIHDVCINKLPVVFAIDRAGLSGRDGETHQGIFDLSFLSSIPNMIVMAPKNKWELDEMLDYALSYDGPIAIRYPKGEAYRGLTDNNESIIHGKSELIHEGRNIAILAVGSMVKTAVAVTELLKEQGKDSTLVNVRFVSPVDYDMLDKLSKEHSIFVTIEENIRSGGYGQQVADYLSRHNKKDIRQINISIPECFVPQGGVDELYKKLGLDAEGIAKRIINGDIL
jgi:1-deoxy-D-xylulose-5-phosphate synthase